MSVPSPIRYPLPAYLKSTEGRSLEPNSNRVDQLGDLPNEALEGKPHDEELSGLLIAPDLPESDSARPEPTGLLLAASGGEGLPADREVFCNKINGT